MEHKPNKKILDHIDPCMLSCPCREGFRAVFGYDLKFRRYGLGQKKVRAKIRILSAELDVQIDEDSDIELVWSLEDEVFYKSRDLSRLARNRYGGGIMLGQGHLPRGCYKCCLVKNRISVDTVSFTLA